MKIPDNIMTIVDACFEANIAFDLAIMIDGVPFRIVSTETETANVINQSGLVIGQLTKD